MNTQLARAIEAVNAASGIVAKLAERNDEATRAVSVAPDNTAFANAVGAAEAQIQSAMDEVEGHTLTKLDYAVDALSSARNAWTATVVSNRLNAADFVAQAVRHMPKARGASND
ncbi:MAG: hypothetical protein SGJ27_17635 [Candidatus Melainabacteria bacterium]|nr:hypothetical protein [Candidatus Melainabacteria bacterium]